MWRKTEINVKNYVLKGISVANVECMKFFVTKINCKSSSGVILGKKQ
jgi:hypothetical protein